MGLEVRMTIVDPTPYLLRTKRSLGEPGIRRVMGRAIGTSIRRHFTKLDSSRANRLGGKRTHFYANARRSVHQPELYGDGVRVVIDALGIAQRYYGGDIFPREANALTIPVHPEAYGHRAREFSDLQYIPTHRGDPYTLAILARPNEASAHGIMEVYYVLCSRVHQEPDPSVLPTDQELGKAAHDAAVDYITTIIKRDGL